MNMQTSPANNPDVPRRGRLLLPLPLLLALALLFTGAAACGSKTSTTTSGAGSSSRSSSGSGSASGSSSSSGSSGTQSGSTASGATAASCTTVGSKRIPKTRVLADLGITAGAFHRYIYKPIKGGTFTGASKAQKVLILGKGALAAGAIAHFLGNAIDNARSDATLCKYVPNMSQIKDKLSVMGSQLQHLGGRLHQQLVQHAAAPDRVHPQRQRHRPRRELTTTTTTTSTSTSTSTQHPAPSTPGTPPAARDHPLGGRRFSASAIRGAAVQIHGTGLGAGQRGRRGLDVHALAVEQGGAFTGQHPVAR